MSPKAKKKDKKKKRKRTSKDDEEEIHELSYYMNDRFKLMKEVVKIMSPKKIKSMAPEFLKVILAVKHCFKLQNFACSVQNLMI